MPPAPARTEGSAQVPFSSSVLKTSARKPNRSDWRGEHGRSCEQQPLTEHSRNPTRCGLRGRFAAIETEIQRSALLTRVGQTGCESPGAHYSITARGRKTGGPRHRGAQGGTNMGRKRGRPLSVTSWASQPWPAAIRGAKWRRQLSPVNDGPRGGFLRTEKSAS